MFGQVQFQLGTSSNVFVIPRRYNNDPQGFLSLCCYLSGRKERVHMSVVYHYLKVY